VVDFVNKRSHALNGPIEQVREKEEGDASRYARRFNVSSLIKSSDRAIHNNKS